MLPAFCNTYAICGTCSQEDATHFSGHIYLSARAGISISMALISVGLASLDQYVALALRRVPFIFLDMYIYIHTCGNIDFNGTHWYSPVTALLVLYVLVKYISCYFIGDYKLHPRFVYATRSPQDIDLINTYSPEESVEIVMLKKELEKCLNQASDGTTVLNIYNPSFIIYLNVR